MILRGEVISLEQCGDSVTLKVQARARTQAGWRDYLRWNIELPEYAGCRHRIGDILKLCVAPAVPKRSTRALRRSRTDAVRLAKKKEKP